jgi:transcriptional regulator with XRE-family HTH domain
MDASAQQLGTNLRRIRRSQGMTLDVLAGRSGVSKSWLSRVERGERSLERRTHLSAVSEALGCSIADLVGQPFPSAGVEQQEIHAAVPALRRALNAYAIGHSEATTARAIGDLRKRATALWKARLMCDAAATWRILPALVADLHAHTVHGREPREAARLLTEVTSAAAFALKGLGYTDLAWIAAEACLSAAHEYGDPGGIALAQYTRAQAASFGHGYAGALHIAETAADDLRAQLVDDPEDARVYGTLLLTGSWADNVAGRGHADAFMAEALDLGARIGDPAKAGDRWQTMFGPSNNVIWQMSIAVEAGHGGRAAELADTIDIAAMPSRSRQAAYWTELGIGLSYERGREQDAIRALMHADEIAPTRTRNNARVRAAVSRMLDDVRQRATGRQLASLAHRVGVDLN